MDGHIIVLIITIGFLVFAYKRHKFKEDVRQIQDLSMEEKNLYLSRAQIEMNEHRTNHILHFLLCIPTAGFWIPVWIIVSHFDSVKRRNIKKLVKETK